MISVDDIISIIASGEGYNAEFKLTVPSKVRELSEEVCAFANAAGGVLLLGVDDSNQIKGIVVDNVKRSAIQNSIREITPILNCGLTFLEIEGKTIGVIEVPSGLQEAGLPEPEFRTKGMFTICLKRPTKASEKTTEKIVDNSSESLDLSTLISIEEAEKKVSEKTSEKILRFIGEDSKITINELALKVGKSTRAIELQLKKLKDNEVIIRKGPDKGGEWVINRR